MNKVVYNGICLCVKGNILAWLPYINFPHIIKQLAPLCDNPIIIFFTVCIAKHPFKFLLRAVDLNMEVRKIRNGSNVEFILLTYEQ
jgi:hypothetical protein